MATTKEDPSVTQYTEAIALKSVIEQLLGAEEWYRLKDTRSLPTWKKSLRRVFQATEVAIEASVSVVDDDWKRATSTMLNNARRNLSSAATIREAFAVVAAFYVSLSFHQLGNMPDSKGSRRQIRATKSNWKLNGFRSVQYVQSSNQKLRLAFRDDPRPLDEKSLDRTYWPLSLG